MTDPDETASLVGKITGAYREHAAEAARRPLPYPHARNDCQRCRERDADFEVTADSRFAGPRTTLLCQQCLGPWSVIQVDLLDGRAALTVEWAPGRLADHGLMAGG